MWKDIVYWFVDEKSENSVNGRINGGKTIFLFLFLFMEVDEWERVVRDFNNYIDFSLKRVWMLYYTVAILKSIFPKTPERLWSSLNFDIM